MQKEFIFLSLQHKSVITVFRGFEEESVEEVEEDLKMGLLASLRSQIITNALEVCKWKIRGRI